jgi:hypothetical protein
MAASDVLSLNRASFWFNRVIRCCWTGKFRSIEMRELRGFRSSSNEIMLYIKSSKAYVN